MIFDDLIPSDPNAFTHDVDYCSIYDTSSEEKKFFDKVLGLRVSVSDDTEISPMDTLSREEDQTVPTKVSELAFNSVASPVSVLGGDGPEPSQENIRAPPPSYEEHKVFSKFHPQTFSCEDLAARWQDIQDIITRESTSITSDATLSFTVLKSTTQPIGTDDLFQSPTCSDISRTADSSDVNSSIAQSPAWYSTSVQESFYSTSPESSSLVLPPRSSNSSPASTAGSFAPSYNNYSASPVSNPNFFDPSSRCTPSPFCKQNSNTTTNPTTTTTTTGEASGMICGMSYQQLKAHIPESGHIQLWQFLIKLLCEPANENCIRWEGTKGHFTIVNQKELAKRWGERKRRKHMTYEKLSRAIRYYYDKNYVQKIHGKKATYVFNFDELFKSQSRPSQQKSKESNEIRDTSLPIKIPSYQNRTVDNKQSMTSTTYSSEMNSLFEYGLPQQAKKIKTAFDTFGNNVQQYFGQEQEYNANISYSTNIPPFFDEDNLLSYY